MRYWRLVSACVWSLPPNMLNTMMTATKKLTRNDNIPKSPQKRSNIRHKLKAGRNDKHFVSRKHNQCNVPLSERIRSKNLAYPIKTRKFLEKQYYYLSSSLVCALINALQSMTQSTRDEIIFYKSSTLQLPLSHIICCISFRWSCRWSST